MLHSREYSLIDIHTPYVFHPGVVDDYFGVVLAGKHHKDLLFADGVGGDEDTLVWVF
jgi:hypothetical protein